MLTHWNSQGHHKGDREKGCSCLFSNTDPIKPSEHGKGVCSFCWPVNIEGKRKPAGGERGCRRPSHTPLLKTLRSSKELSVHLPSQNLLPGVTLRWPSVKHVEWAMVALKASVTVWLVSTERTGVPSEAEHGNEGEDAGTPPDQLVLTHCI